MQADGQMSGSLQQVVSGTELEPRADSTQSPARSGVGGVLPPVLDACCGPRMMWVNKRDPRAIYFDRRDEDYVITPNAAYPNGTTLRVRPDVKGTFTALPFPSESFRLVVFDPPHFTNLSGETVLGKTYSKLFPDWEDELREGFAECFRVLKPEGVLIFKWCSVQIPLERVLALAPEPPLFGHNTGHRAQTHWMTFLKGGGGAEQAGDGNAPQHSGACSANDQALRPADKGCSMETNREPQVR